MFIEVFLYIATFYLIWHLAFVPYLLRSTRADLFDIRDSLFIKYSGDPEYTHVRNWINVFIRYANKASWQHYVFFRVCFWNKKNTQALPRFHNEDINRAFAKSMMLIIKLFILRSPLIVVVLSCVLVLLIVYSSSIRWCLDYAKKAIFNDAAILQKDGL